MRRLRTVWLLALALLMPRAAAQCGSQSLADPAFVGKGDQFGLAVAIQGDELFVGAPGFPYVPQPFGLVQVFRDVGGTWQHEQTLQPPDGAEGLGFGWRLAVQDDLLVVGAPSAFVGHTLQGAVYLFERQAGAWVATEKLVASDGASFDNFGQSVALDGARLVVGADGVDQGFHLNTGAAYVFERGLAGWEQKARLSAHGLADQDNFGRTVDIEGDTVVVGKPDGNLFFDPGGRVHVFWRDATGAWNQTQVLQGDDAEGDLFGLSLALEGDRLFVGAELDSAGTPFFQGGAVYVFERQGPGWALAQRLVSGDPSDAENFGFALAAQGERLIVGSGLTSALVDSPGSVHVFEHDSGRWTRVWTFDAPSSLSVPACFGGAVALDGEHLVMGADRDGTLAEAAGEAFVQDLGTFHEPFGAGVPGSGGLVPELLAVMCGPAGTATLTLTIEHGVGGALGALVVGKGPDAAPFAGGSLFPAPPWRLVPYVLDGAPGVADAGSLTVSAPVPASVSALELAVQAVHADAGAAGGFALSAGLRLTFP